MLKIRRASRHLRTARPMARLLNRWWVLVFTFVVIAAAPSLWRVAAARPHGGAYYVDCSAQINGNGSRLRPWNSLAAVDSFDFAPGDQLRFRRGTTCRGPLHPKGSGAPGAPIVVGAYGKGPRPVIDGGDALAAVELFDQSYWEIGRLEIVGGERYGIFVSGDEPHSHLTHIYLSNLDVHGAHFTSRRRTDSGEVYLSPHGVGEALDDVRLDGVVAHDSRVSEGILVNAGGAFEGSRQTLGSNIVVERSAAHNVYGDGIVVTEAQHAVIRDCVVHDTGLCPKCSGSTPDGLWEWYCHYCVIEGNESYANRSWARQDGGDFDIDYYNSHNVVQYNYGHDSAGYCISFFGAGGTASVDNVFRYNICSNNGRNPKNAFQGGVFVFTWNGGSLDGVEIYNNTFYWNPAVNAPLLQTAGAVTRGPLPRFFKNNIIFSTVPSFVNSTSAFTLDHNLYWTTARSSIWRYDGKAYTNFAAYQAATHQDTNSFNAPPHLRDAGYNAVGRPVAAFTLLPGSPALKAGAGVCCGVEGCSMGTRDFWGHPIPLEGPLNIGASQAP